MARRLAAAGHKVCAYDVRADALAALTGAGIEAVDSLRSLADRAASIFISLPTPAIVARAVLGEGGLLAGGRRRCLIDLSTTGPQTAQEMALACSAQGVEWVDSPVSGGVAGARNGTLAVMVACERTRFAELEPVLANFGRVFWVGAKAGQGQVMKLANNFLSATALAATSEAVVFAVKAGLDAKTAIEVINTGTGLNTASRDKFPRSILPRTFNHGFATGLMLKDLVLCHDAADAMGFAMPVADAVRGAWEATQQQLGADSDFTCIVQVAEQRAGVIVRGE
jgi:3-hydroxyisobutyrate dehydrogenase-like beta-hydroxyacid dehydrogenase